MKRNLFGLLVSVVLLCAPEAAQAQNITYTFDGTASGTLGDAAFTDAAFTITTYADTGTIVNCGGGVFSVDNISADIAISGFDDATFSIPTRLFNNQSVSVAGFSLAGCFGSDLLDLSDPAFRTYDLSTSFGPIFVAEPFAAQFGNVPTSGGILTMTTASNVTFNAMTLSPGNGLARETSSPGVSDSVLRGIIGGVNYGVTE